MVKISEFQTKDVVNIKDGKKLGHVSDFELDLQNGRVDAIVLPGTGKLMGLFGNRNDTVIPWRNIIKIGKDVILVRLEESLKAEHLKDDEFRPYGPKDHT